MIVIQSFKEIVVMHKSGVMPFRIVQEITAVLLGLCSYTKNIPEPVGVTQQEIDWMLALSEEIEFMHYLGGHVFLAETEEDLKQFIGIDPVFASQHGRHPDCSEEVLALDDARILVNADGTADYALLFAATNNAGGPSWFIPKALWQAAQVDKQIEAHQQFWSVAK